MVHFVWQGLRLAQQIDAGQARKRTWLYDPARAYAPLACVDQTPGDRKGSIYHYHTDPTGTPREVTDENGKLVWQASYSAWGRVRANLVLNNGREFEQPLRLPGQYHDAESGLHYNTFRYYDAHCGKFISSDPIGLAGGLNLYAYAPNPFSWIDPLGWAYQGVDFTGSPDLFPVTGDQENIVQILMQGSRTRDFTQAFEEAGISRADARGYTWHHLDDFNPETGKTTMQLVKTEAHVESFPHAGSADQFAKHFGVEYDSNKAVAVSQEQGWLKGRTPKIGC